MAILRREAESKRNRIQKILSNAGITPIIPQGGYYTVANWTTMIDLCELDDETEYELLDYQFVSWLVKNLGVYGLPLSSAYPRDHAQLGGYGMRITMIKVSVFLKNRGFFLNV